MPRCGIIRLEPPKAMDAVVAGILSSFRSIDYGSCLFLPWSLNFFLPYVTPNLNFVPYLAVPSISTLHGVKLDVNRPFHPFEVCNARPSFSPVLSSILNWATYVMQTTFVCKLWKFQSGSSDQHLKTMGDGIILQSGPAFELDNHIFTNPPSHSCAPPLGCP